jgi:FK506-binding nuclear protein
LSPPQAKEGKTVVVRYVGKLTSGKVFDQTKGSATFKFRLGLGEVIKGWDRGVVGMRVGDKRRLTVPPGMAYGTQGVRGAIPPNVSEKAIVAFTIHCLLFVSFFFQSFFFKTFCVRYLSFFCCGAEP